LPLVPGRKIVEPVADEDVQRLGRADAVQDDRPGLLLPAAEHVAGERLARRDAGAQAGKVPRAGFEGRKLRGIECRHAVEDRRPEGLDGGEGRLRRRATVVEDGGATDPQRKSHAVAQAIGEEQLGGGVADVPLGDAQHAHSVELAGDHHVALGVDRALGPPGRARRIEPEAIIPRRGEPGLERGRGLCHLREEGVDRHRLRRLGPELLQGRLDLTGELGRIGDQPTSGILDHVGIVRGPQQGVGRHRHDAGLDGAPEEIEEGRAVLHHHQQAVAGRQPVREQRVARPVHALGKLRIGHRFLARQDRGLLTASFRQVTVDEGHGGIEAGRQSDGMRGREGNA